MKPDEIITLLKTNEDLRKFAVAFYERLHLDNPIRDAARDRNDHQIFMDNLGRLLVGDETVAAIAADGSNIYVSSNQNNHSAARVSVKIDDINFTFSEDGTTAECEAEAVMSFSNDGATQVIKKTIYFGQYLYDTATHSLTPTDEIISCEATYAEHKIDAYPYPISSPITRAKINLPSSFIVFPKTTYHSHNTTPAFVTRLDPLFRRSAAIISHLGLICNFFSQNRSAELLNRYENALAWHRERVLIQTLGWVLPEKYKLGKTIRRYDDSGLQGQARRDHIRKKSELDDLHEFIRDLTKDFNIYRNRFSASTNLSSLIKRWRLQKLEDIYHRRITPPSVISSNPNFGIDKFLTMYETYMYALLQMEQYITKKTKFSPDILTSTLAAIGRDESGFGKDIESNLIIVDDLANGTHAEMRLFSRLVLDGQRQPGSTPYFGITQLCCACCNTFFKSHGLNYVEGSMHRAGTHAKYYPDWVFGTKFRRPEILERFFGSSYPYFMALDDNIQVNGETKTCKEWAFLIIQDLAGLWFSPSEERLKELDALGFKHGGIFRQGSNYLERSDQLDQEPEQEVQDQMAYTP